MVQTNSDMFVSVYLSWFGNCSTNNWAETAWLLPLLNPPAVNGDFQRTNITNISSLPDKPDLSKVYFPLGPLQLNKTNWEKSTFETWIILVLCHVLELNKMCLNKSPHSRPGARQSEDGVHKNSFSNHQILTSCRYYQIDHTFY